LFSKRIIAVSNAPITSRESAIGEIFDNRINCIISEKDNVNFMCDTVKIILENNLRISAVYNYNMRDTISGYTWSNVANKIKELL